MPSYEEKIKELLTKTNNNKTAPKYISSPSGNVKAEKDNPPLSNKRK